MRDVITSISFRNGHKAPPKSLGHLRLREPRRQPLQKFAQKAPQPTALKPPSTARTAGRSDRAERRFRRQPFILLSFSSSEKLRKAQETQSYQRFQHIVHTDFNTSGTNAPRSLSCVKAGTHSAFGERSHTAAHTAKHGAFRMGVVSLPSDRSTRSPTSPGRVSERRTLPLLGLGRGCAPEERREPAEQRCAYARRCSEGVAAPLGCVIFLQFGDVAVFSLCAQYFLNVRGRGVLLPSACFTRC